MLSLYGSYYLNHVIHRSDSKQVSSYVDSLKSGCQCTSLTVETSREYHIFTYIQAVVIKEIN